MPEAIANHIFEGDRDLVLQALANLVEEEADRLYLDPLLQRELKENPGRAADRLCEGRGIASTLCIPLWFLLGLDEERWSAALAAAIFVHLLRQREEQPRRALNRDVIRTDEYLAQVCREHDMEPREIMRRLEAATNRIVLELKTSSGTTEEKK
jgi:hypothetical protein